MDWLLVVDTPSIKRFVFNTGRLAEIRGGSEILDRLNRKTTDALFQDMLGAQTVYSNGGSGQFIARNRGRMEIRGAIQRLRRVYHEETLGGATILVGYAELSGGAGYRNALQRAHGHLAEAKNSLSDGPRPVCHTGYLRECDSCSSGIAQEALWKGDDRRLLCQVCLAKNGSAKERRVWREFVDAIGMGEEGGHRWYDLQPEDFNEIGNASARRGYIGVVYADGNAMGRLIKRIDSHERYTLFSEATDGAIRHACYHSLRELFPTTIDGKIPADILLLGGDDLIVCLPADRALPFAEMVSEKFNTATKTKFAGSSDRFFDDLLKGQGLSVSVGVAIGKSATPFALLLDQAEELLASAKLAGSQHPEASDYHAPTFVDFHLTSRFGQVEVSEARKIHYHSAGPTSVRQTLRPYHLADYRALLRGAARLRQVIPRSRLARLGEAPFMGWGRGSLEAIRLFSRGGAEERVAITEEMERFGCMVAFPWRRCADGYETALADLVELSDFLGEEHASD